MTYRIVSDTPAIDWEAHRILSTSYKHLDTAEDTARLLTTQVSQSGKPRYANVRVITECSDADCRAQGCPEHPYCDGGDHTYEQHHSPIDHLDGSPCRCNVYLPNWEK